MMNFQLKIAMLQSGLKQIELARKLGIGEALCSKIINGWVNPKDELKKSISKILGKPIEELFINEKEVR